jgi:CBS domain-containing protein
MPNAFNFSASPFDCLSTEEQQLVRDSVDVAYFPEGDTILDTGAQPSHLFIIIKGFVQQLDGDEVVATFGPDDTFDGRGLVAGKVSNRFVAAEEVVTYLLAKQTVSALISDNATFGALLFSDLSNKLSALSERHSQHELQSLTMAQVQQAFLRPAHVVDGATDIYTIVETFTRQHTAAVLVQDTRSDPPRMGIFTTTGLQRAILHGTPLKELPVVEVATFPIVSIAPTAHVFDALTAMIRHKVHRLVVADGERVVGVLEQLDLLSFLSNHSHLITLQIADAKDIATLKSAAEQITRLIVLLHRGGTRVSQVAQLVQELNARLFERAWQLIAPRELVINSCLFVMGSEGRGEQVLKTDQDNGLVLRDGYTPPADFEAICQRFSEALIEFGYPECPGHIMVNNPQWRHPAAEFGQVVRRWLTQPDADSLMSLAIFLDAHAVSGDPTLLEGVRGEVFKLVSGSDAMLGRFAASIDAFSNTSGWWNRLLSLGVDGKERLNLKKAGVFPLVHGVRSMALAQRLPATSSVERIAELVRLGKLPANVGTELTDSLHFFMGLKLKAGLGEMETGKPVSGSVDPDKLSPLDRDLLKDALGAVKRFKAMLRHQFHMEIL